MGYVTKMKITFCAQKSRKQPKAGDTKIVKGRKFVRRQQMSQGAYCVRNGRPLWEWVAVTE